MKRLILICGLAVPALAATVMLLQSEPAIATGRPSSPELLGKPFLEGPPALRSVDGRRIDLRPAQAGATVVVFVANDDPAAAGISSSLAILIQKPGVSAVVVRVGPEAPPPGESPAVVHDPAGAIARRFGAARSGESFVLVGRARLLHRGPFDLHEVFIVVDAAREEIAPMIASRPTLGPALPLLASAAAPPTYTVDVEPILRRSCRDCHRPGESAPFSLVSYDQARKRAGDLATVVESGFMPPWKPESDFGPPLRHDRTLLPDEIATIRAWADAGAPRGPAVPEPPTPPTPPGGWTLGTPDLVLEPAEPFDIPATGSDVYRCFVLPAGVPGSRWITAIEVLPGNPRVVHHTFGYIDVRSLARERDAADPEPGYMCFSGFTGDSIFGALGGWTPGNSAHHYAEGVAQGLPPDADVVMQVHYHPSGKPERDRTRLGLHFARSPIRKALQWVSACADPAEFVIPADDPDVRWKAELKIPMDVELHAMTPHMHMLGRSMEAKVLMPDGRSLPLIRIADWDFNRQDTYHLRDPMRIPEGSTIRIEARFDNTSANPRNPSNPPRPVRWGEGTDDDMMILFLGLTRADQDLTAPGAVDDFMEEFFRRAGVEASDEPEPEAR